ncbi:MAG: DUF3786 domain-containing protein [Dehalococcoidales bacterium]|nr:DUF3786 domain-containing protein [Dehalococcoidales bacterium]
MENSRLPLPHQCHYEQAYGLAYRLAAEELNRRDIRKLCSLSGARYLEGDAGMAIALTYLNRSYRITLPDVAITPAGSREPLSIREKVLILHYLTLARGTPVTGRAITFKELPEGPVYFPTFAKRTVDPLLARFGKEPGRMLNAAGKLGGRRADYGDAAVAIQAFPLVAITPVLWRGDSEFAPSASIIFDAGITGYLSTEDVTVLCETVVWKLIKSLE